MFYAYHNRYGIGVRAEEGYRIGYVVCFSNRRARDEYVSSDSKAEAISSKEARAEMCDYLMANAYMTDANVVSIADFDSPYQMNACLSAEEIAELYCAVSGLAVDLC